MSKEISLLARCPHLIIEERVTLSEDRRLLIPQQPIVSSQSVQIMANDDIRIVIPQAGLAIPAQLTGAVSGPFNIQRGVNTFTVSSGLTALTVELPTGTRVTTDDVVRALQAQGSSFFFGNANGHLFISDSSSVGVGSKLKVSGDAVEAVGFVNQVGARGRQLFPGWRLVKKDDTTTRIIRFAQPIKNNPILKVTYAANQANCLRCGAALVENDWTFDNTGQTFIIENEDLLHQAALKIVFTEKGSNIFQTFYGTELISRIGSKAIGAVTAQINEDVRRALRTMQRLQQGQRRYQIVTDKELLLRVDYVRTTPREDDLTAFDVQVGLRNAANQPVNLSVFFTVPQVISRMAERQLGI